MTHAEAVKAVADAVDRHQQRLCEEIGKHLARSVGVRTILESLAVEVLLKSEEKATPVAHPRVIQPVIAREVVIKDERHGRR